MTLPYQKRRAIQWAFELAEDIFQGKIKTQKERKERAYAVLRHAPTEVEIERLKMPEEE